MEEKKVTKISLSTFLFTISLIIIVIMGIFIFKLNNEKTIETQKSIDLQVQVNSLKDTVRNLQEKINIVSETIKSDTEPINDVTANNPAEDKYTEITGKLSDNDIFFVTNADKNNDGTYTLKGVLYTKFTLTKTELENAVNNGGYKYYNSFRYSQDDPIYATYTIKKNYQEDMSDIKYDYAFIGKFKNEDRLCFYAVKKDDNTYYIENTTECSTEWKLTSNLRKITVSGDIAVECEYDESSNVKNYFDNYKDKKAVDTGHPSGCFGFEFTNGKCSKIFECVTGH